VEPKEIRELIQLISESEFTTFELERNDFRIKLVRESGAALSAVPVAAHAVPAPVAERPAEPVVVEVPAAAPVEDGLLEFNSPIVGTFYSAPSPDAAEFVQVGATVSKGQVLCIVEAMKVMNEIESEIDAVVAEILVKNGQPVEYGEVLFRLRPT
jgi:acetyl-CoA carboxylase biotin carboxyl carrier protein